MKVAEIKLQILSGMELVKLLSLRNLHPNIHTQFGSGVKFNVYHNKYALHTAIYFFCHPILIYLGLATHNNPFRAHNDSIETRIPTRKISEM